MIENPSLGFQQTSLFVSVMTIPLGSFHRYLLKRENPNRVRHMQTFYEYIQYIE